MKVRVNDSLCQGHGRCYAVASQLFEPDEIGNGHAVEDGEVPADQINGPGSSASKPGRPNTAGRSHRRRGLTLPVGPHRIRHLRPIRFLFSLLRRVRSPEP